MIRKSVPTEEVTNDKQFVAEITDLAREYLDKKKVSEKIETDLRSLQEGIKQRLRQKGVRKVPGVVSWSFQKGRTSYDYKAIREAAENLGLDIEEFATVGEQIGRAHV